MLLLGRLPSAARSGGGGGEDQAGWPAPGRVARADWACLGEAAGGRGEKMGESGLWNDSGRNGSGESPTPLSPGRPGLPPGPTMARDERIGVADAMRSPTRRRTRSTTSSFHEGVTMCGVAGISTPARYVREALTAVARAEGTRRDGFFLADNETSESADRESSRPSACSAACFRSPARSMSSTLRSRSSRGAGTGRRSLAVPGASRGDSLWSFCFLT
mmetsp:Transcript_9899/g.32751  ORF Transcript_9899/g.32751 Transcript_9899/m.32751 type:complete len:218 (-) Transcript_9899:40-693(-)|eukprot:scaffold8132_cov85-Isochrysis_galbana.AAC.1